MKQVYILAIIFSIPFIGFSQDRESDSLALVSIYQSLDGDNWPQNDNWLSDLPLEEWKGIGTFNDRVNKLEIKSQASAGIAGDFPLQVLDLTELKTFELGNISINGPIPESLVQLTKLDRIVFKYCNLTGDLPLIFDQFENLRTLVLSFNELTGPLPALPQSMSLAYIDRNQFSGSIPESWSGNEISNLEIHGNNLTGNYDILSTMPSLRSITIGDNDWDEHTLPLWIDDIPFLNRFSCNGCNIIGEIPSELDFSTKESYSGMFLSDNQLSGDISILFNNPEFDKKLYLRVRNNNFSGELPVHKMVSFNQLDVYGNHYSSMTSPLENVEYSVDILYNDFNYERLNQVQEYIALDSIINIKYWNQNPTGVEDTITITTQASITLNAGDTHPNTVYQWYKGNQEIEGETNNEILLEVTENNQSGWYKCKMTNPDYPELDLESNRVTLDIDISTSTYNTPTPNITISPNPITEYLSLTGVGNDSYKYEIKSMSGRTVSTGNYVGNIDVSLLEAGVYVLSVEIGNEVRNTKFIKL